MQREDIDIEKRKLVAVHFSNGLGNFIQMTPAIQALSEFYDAGIDLILDRKWTDSRRKSVIDFCSKWDLINEVKDFQDGFNKERYEQLFYVRHGENCEAASFFQNQAGYDASHINWRSEKVNEVDHYMSEVYRLGYRGKVPPLYRTDIYRPEEGQKEEYNNTGINFDVGFCNGFFAGSKWKWERKGWPYFPELARLLKRYYPRTRLHLLGRGKAEEDWAQSVDTGKDWVQNKVGDYNIHETIWRLNSLDLLITTDTGLMHIADAREIPMVVLFGPTLVSKNGPYNKEHRIARSPLQCAPCQQNHMFHSCKDWKCMRELKPWMVMAIVREYLLDLIKRRNKKTLVEDRKAVERYDRKKAIGDWKRISLLKTHDLTKVKEGLLY